MKDLMLIEDELCLYVHVLESFELEIFECMLLGSKTFSKLTTSHFLDVGR